MSIIELIEQLKAMPEKMEGYRSCPLYEHYYRCEFAWAQMPYDEGGAK